MDNLICLASISEVETETNDSREIVKIKKVVAKYVNYRGKEYMRVLFDIVCFSHGLNLVDLNHNKGQ